MYVPAILVMAVLGGVLPHPAAAQSPTKTEKATVWLPPRPTSAGEHIYASVITAAASSTEYLLACTSAWKSASSCSQFPGVTLTYGNNTMRIGFRSESFDCKRGSEATCSVSAPSTVNAQSVLPSSASAAWFTAITIVDGHDKLKGGSAKTSSSTSSNPAAAATATSAGVCKRSTKGSGSGTGDSVQKPKNNGVDGCSAAGGGGFEHLPLMMAGVAVVVGVVMTAFL